MIFALGRHLVESTIFALITAMLIFVVGKWGAATRHALWTIAIAKFGLPVTVLTALGSKIQRLFPNSGPLVSVPNPFPSFVDGNPSGAHSANTLVSYFTAAWIVVALIMFAVWLPKLFASYGPLGNVLGPEQEVLRRLKQRFGIRSAVHLRFSDGHGVPELRGIFRPVITIPRGLTADLSEPELESVILHELAHAKRFDNLSSALAHSVACVFWFYPLLWWIEIRLHAEREHACDEMVVRAGVAPEDYVKGILKVCRFHLNCSIAGVSAVSGSNLEQRMEAIMSLPVSPERNVRVPKTLVGGLLAVMMIVPLLMGSLFSARANGQSPDPKQEGKPANPETSVNCVFASVKYPEGAVVQEDGGPEQMCVRVLDGDGTIKSGVPQFTAQWIRTSKAIRERSNSVIHISLPPPGPSFCNPKPSSEKAFCACDESSPYSQDSVVDSSKGKLRCDQGKWVPVAASLSQAR